VTRESAASRPLAAVIVGFDGATLRHLAAVADQRDAPRWLDPLGLAEELAEIIGRGDRPALGLYRRHLAPRPVPGPPGPAHPDVYRRVLLGMVATGWPRRVAAEAVADLALADGLEEHDVAEIVANALAA
jgi:hypothetical protein